jgi:hypothetical protein
MLAASLASAKPMLPAALRHDHPSLARSQRVTRNLPASPATIFALAD